MENRKTSSVTIECCLAEGTDLEVVAEFAEACQRSWESLFGADAPMNFNVIFGNMDIEEQSKPHHRYRYDVPVMGLLASDFFKRYGDGQVVQMFSLGINANNVLRFIPRDRVEELFQRCIVF